MSISRGLNEFCIILFENNFHWIKYFLNFFKFYFVVHTVEKQAEENLIFFLNKH